MKKLSITNFLGIKEAVLGLGARNLICGPNGAGKSSIQNAIRFAFCGDSVRVNLKKDTKLLIADGSKAASIDIDGSQINILPAKVINSGVVMAEIIPAFLLDMASFSASDPSGRSAMIDELSGALSPDALLGAALAAGLDAEKVKTVMPLVVASLQDAEAEAAKQERSLKSEWKGITGESWGAEKALFWKPDVDPEAAAKMGSIDAKISETDADLMKLLVEISDDERHVQPLRSACEGIETLEAEYKLMDDDRIACKQVVDDYDKALIEGNPFSELCSSLADVSAAMEAGPVACPCCSGGLLAIPADSGAPGLVSWAAAEAAIAPHSKAIADYQNAVREATAASVRVGREYAKLSKVREAKAKLAEVMKERAPDFDLVAAKAKAEELRERKNGLYLRKQEVMRAAGLAEKADELAARAKGVSDQIGLWLGVAEFFSPSGEAAKLLAEAMGRLNGSLAAYATITGWRPVVVDSDFGITYGGRELRLLSESEKWRADAMIAAALVGLYGRDVPLLLDRIDVLDLEGRGQLLDWCEQSEGQWLLFGTLKACPALDGFNSFWVENGLCCQ